MPQTELLNLPIPIPGDLDAIPEIEEMMLKLDGSMSPSYADLTGWTVLNAKEFTVPKNQTNSTRMRPGRPVRFGDKEDRFLYGMIKEVDHELAPDTIWVEVAGAPIDPAIQDLQIGQSSMMKRLRFTFPAGWATSPGEILSGSGNGFTWMGGPAYIVAVGRSVRSPLTPYPNLGVFTVDPLVGDQRWCFGGPAGGTIPVNTNHDMSLASYEITDYTDGYSFHNSKLVNQMQFYVTQDASGSSSGELTMDIYIALEGSPILVDRCGDGEDVPQVEMTISGIPTGEKWLNLDNGSHDVCPQEYRRHDGGPWTIIAFEGMYPFNFSGSFEAWAIGNPIGIDVSWFLLMGAYGYGTGPGGPRPWSTHGWQVVGSFNGTQYGTINGLPAGGEGWIHDFQFTTYVIGPVTITVSRGPGPWRQP